LCVLCSRASRLTGTYLVFHHGLNFAFEDLQAESPVPVQVLTNSMDLHMLAMQVK